MQARADAGYSLSSCIWIHLILCPHIFTFCFYACQQITYFPNMVFLDWTRQSWHSAWNLLWEHGMLRPCDPPVSLMRWYKKKYAQNAGLSHCIARKSIGLFLSMSVWAAFCLDGLEIFYFILVPNGDLSVFKKNRTNSWQKKELK